MGRIFRLFISPDLYHFCDVFDSLMSSEMDHAAVVALHPANICLRFVVVGLNIFLSSISPTSFLTEWHFAKYELE